MHFTDGQGQASMDDMHPTVTVAVPVYNGERFLRECLESVAAQSFVDYEVLVIDDGSTDSSPELMMEYARCDPRIRALRNSSNLGLARNWNECMLQAQGKWVKFLFQDDRLDPRCLEVMMAADQCDAGLISCNRQFAFDDPDDTGNEYYRSTVRHLASTVASGTFVPAEDFSCHILRFLTDNSVSINFIGEPSNMMIRRDVILELGMFNPALLQACDYEYWSRVGSNYGAVLVPEVLSQFRIHKLSTTAHNRDKRRFLTSLDLPAVLHDFLFAPVYWRFRQAIGEAGRDRLHRYATKLLRHIQSEASAVTSTEEKGAWLRFLEMYPMYVDTVREPSFRDMSRTLRRYLKAKVCK